MVFLNFLFLPSSSEENFLWLPLLNRARLALLLLLPYDDANLEFTQFVYTSIQTNNNEEMELDEGPIDMTSGSFLIKKWNYHMAALIKLSDNFFLPAVYSTSMQSILRPYLKCFLHSVNVDGRLIDQSQNTDEEKQKEFNEISNKLVYPSEYTVSMQEKDYLVIFTEQWKRRLILGLSDDEEMSKIEFKNVIDDLKATPVALKNLVPDFSRFEAHCKQ